jgi:hypothetical protein
MTSPKLPKTPKRVTYQQYRNFIKDFNQQGQLRMGQAFCNLFNFQGEEDNVGGCSLFYETNNAKAHARIWHNYVWEEINNGAVGW